MKKMLIIVSMLALFLSACSESPERVAQRAKQEQRLLEEENQTKQMKATRQAIFKEEATFQDNCKAGRVMWIGGDGWRREVNAVVCDGLPTNSLEYTIASGKSRPHVGYVEIGEPVDHVAAAKKVIEEAEKRAAEEAKAKVLSKLSTEEKKALGL